MGGGQRLGLALALTLLAMPGAAQQRPMSPFLFINQERILTESNTGKRLLEEEAKAQNELRSEARATDTAFETEERHLTELRKTLSTEEFRKRANDFDERVVKARQAQDAKSSALAQDLDHKRRQFYASVAPLLVTVMERYGAHAIFDETSVLLADDSLNITSAVIAEIDAKAAQTIPVPSAPDAPKAETPESGAPLPGKD